MLWQPMLCRIPYIGLLVLVFLGMVCELILAFGPTGKIHFFDAKLAVPENPLKKVTKWARKSGQVKSSKLYFESV